MGVGYPETAGIGATLTTRCHRIRIRWVLALALVSMVVPIGSYAAEPAIEPAPPPYLFGVFPHLAVARLEKIYAPIAADFGRALDRRVYFRTKPSFEKFMEELRKQTYDIVFLQPFDYVWAHDSGYLPLARRGEPLTAQIMIAEDSPLHALKDLKGGVVALPPAEAAVSHLAKLALLDAGLDPHRDVSLQYTKSHDSCLQRLLIGAVDACVTAAGPARFFQARMKVSFHILARSQTIPHALIAVHSRVPENERERLRAAILSWPDSPEGRRLLAAGELTPFQLALDDDYDVVRNHWKRFEK